MSLSIWMFRKMFLSFLLQEDFISPMMECFLLTYSIKRRYPPGLNVYWKSRCVGYLWPWTLSTGVLTEFNSQICSWRGVDICRFWIKFSYLGSFYLCDSLKQKCNQILFSVPDSLILWIDEVHMKLQSPKWTTIEFLSFPWCTCTLANPFPLLYAICEWRWDTRWDEGAQQ